MNEKNPPLDVLPIEPDKTPIETPDIDEESGGGSKIRKIVGKPAVFLSIFAILTSLFHIYANSFGFVPEMQKCTIHVACLLFMAFYMYPISKKNKGNPKWYDYLLAVIGFGCAIYVAFRFDPDFAKFGVSNPIDTVMAALTVVLILEAARRTLGPIIPIISILFILYALFSSYMPGSFRFPSASFSRLMYRLYLTTEGIWSTLVNTSSTYIFVFILFGAFLQSSGGSAAFNDIGYAIGGRMRGGPAQVAVVSSALMGSISGSAVANVMTTGAFSIPLMKKVGYSPEFAGGVEAAASTGGVIMPPVMGAVAFLMASTLGISYTSVVKSAILPAVLYYVGIAVSVDLEAQKRNLQGLPKESLPTLGSVLKKRGINLLPIVGIIVLLVMGKTALFAGFFGIAVAIISSWFNKETRMDWRKIAGALEAGAKGAITVGIACAACSFIVTVCTLTGLGSTLALNIMELSHGIPFLALLLIAVIILFMSMGMPGNAVYIVVAVVAAPALTKLGYNLIAVHFFIMWIGTMSNMTPPVCMASYAASSLAGGNMSKTALSGLKLAASGLIVPFMFIHNPRILMQDVTPLSYIWVFITSTIGVYSLAMALHGYWKIQIPWFLRIVLFAAAITLINPTIITDIIGIVLLSISIAAILLINKKRQEKDAV